MKSISILCLSLASGGAERVISLLLSRLINDYKVTLVLFYKSIHYHIPDEVEVIYISNKSPRNGIGKLILLPKALWKYYFVLEKRQVEVSISFLTIPNILNSCIKLLKHNIRIVISERNYPSIEYRSSSFRFFLYKKALKYFYSLPDVLFSNSIKINEDLKENFEVKREMHVIYNPIKLPVERINPQKIRPGSALRIVTVGRLIKTKNQEMIINALANIKDRNIKLTIVGDGPLRNYLSKLLRELCVKENVEFTGNIINVNEILMRHHCFVLTSVSEGFPNALLEAMAIGLPVISTNCMSGPLEILNENKDVLILNGDFVMVKYGILVNVGDSAGLSKAINFLYSNQDILAKLSKLSLERSKEYDLEKIYEKFRYTLLKK